MSIWDAIADKQYEDTTMAKLAEELRKKKLTPLEVHGMLAEIASTVVGRTAPYETRPTHRNGELILY